jgi:dihydrofolate reductase
MRIVISEFVSLDGVSQAPGGPDEDRDGGFAHGGWSMPFFDPDAMGAALGAAMTATGALLFGRRTWRVMAAAWPERAGDPFADRMNEITKYVVSSTLTLDEVTWTNSNLIPAGDLEATVRRLRDAEGGDVQVMGSLSLARWLTGHNLVDEYILMVEPITLGGGKRLFPDDGQARTLKLVEATPTKTGVVICRYQPIS